MERVIVGARSPWVAIPDEHAGNANPTRAAHQPLARHAGAAADEPWPAKPPSRVVRPGRARKFAAPAAAPHGRDGEPQIQQSGRPRVSGPEPTRNAVRP